MVSLCVTIWLTLRLRFKNNPGISKDPEVWFAVVWLKLGKTETGSIFNSRVGMDSELSQKIIPATMPDKVKNRRKFGHIDRKIGLRNQLRDRTIKRSND